MAQATDLLKRVYLFENLSAEDLLWLAEAAKGREVIAGDSIFNEGETAKSFFVVRSGTVEIRKKGVQDEQSVATLGSGSVLGEMAFVTNQPRSASAIAKENLLLLEVPYPVLEQRIQSKPDFGVQLYRTLAGYLGRRITQTSQDLASLKELKLRST